jgi:hypothetical protein
MKKVSSHNKLILLIGIVVLFTGCASVQEPISVNQSIYQDGSENRIAVIMTPLPEPDLAFPGADCLLCLVTAEALHTSLSDHAEGLDGSEFKLSKTHLADRLRDKGVDAVVVDEPLVLRELPKVKSSSENSVGRDFSALAEAHNVDYVLVISVSAYGFNREFASYIPTSEPMAVFKGKGFMVDPKTNTYVWYRPFDMAMGVEGEWDQPPEFPKLTNAFYQVVAEARDAVLAEF